VARAARALLFRLATSNRFVAANTEAAMSGEARGYADAAVSEEARRYADAAVSGEARRYADAATAIGL
jgi:hypothetical protein